MTTYVFLVWWSYFSFFMLITFETIHRCICMHNKYMDIYIYIYIYIYRERERERERERKRERERDSACPCKDAIFAYQFQ